MVGNGGRRPEVRAAQLESQTKSFALALPEFLDQGIVGIDGLEVYYPGHDEEHEKILLGWAEQYGLLITGGSDCHDSNKRPLGVSGITQQELDRLIERIG